MATATRPPGATGAAPGRGGDARPDSPGGAGAGPWRAAALLVFAHILLALMVFDPTPHTGGDNAAYMSLARALLDHGAYIELWDPAPRLHTQYPPVFPGVLAVVLLAGVQSWAALKLLTVAFSAAAVAATYLWLASWRGPRFALGVTAVVAFAPGVLQLSHWVLSDVPFWALTTVALWGCERFRAGERAGLALAVAGATLAFFTRSAGLPLVAALAAWLALRRHWRALAAFAIVIVPLAAIWWMRTRAVGDAAYLQQLLAVNPYVPELGRIGPVDLLDRVVENDYRYLARHLPRLLTGAEGGLLLALGSAIAVLALFGWVERLASPGVPELFLPLYVGLLLVWPAVWAGDRFLLPVLPLILAYAGESVLALARRLRRVPTDVAGAVAVLALVLAGAPALLADARTGAECTRAYLERGDRYPCVYGAWRDFFEMAEWSRDRLPSGAVVLSRKPRLFYALAERRGRTYPRSDDPGRFFAAAREAGARHVLLARVDGLWELYLGPVLLDRIDSFCVVHSLGTDRATLFGIRADPELSAAPPGVEDAWRGFGRCPPEDEAMNPQREPGGAGERP